VFWRREVIDEIGVFDVNEHLAMDYDYWLRAGAKHDPGFIDAHLAAFRVHPRSKSSMGFSKQANEALRISRRYASSAKRDFLAPLQYLNYFLVVLIYSVLNLISILRAKWGQPVP